MTAKELYREFLLKLQDLYELSEATVITDLVFESIAGIKKAGLLINPNTGIDPVTLDELNWALTELREHKPVQYVLGECWFHHLKYKVNEQVLIPRPETEELADWVLRDFKTNIYRVNQSGGTEKHSRLSILDIGTGSGCIAITLKKNLPGSQVTALDISQGALDLARENAHTHHAEIQLVKMDFLRSSQWPILPKFDIIISNPPYIPLSEKDKLDKHVVDFEPHTALFVPEDDPCIFYRRIAAFCLEHLKKTGSVYLEVDATHAEEVATLFKPDFKQIEIRKDLYGRERMIKLAY
ncbi:MAG: peptide chain release factor N(5)-glutamine methyltransferase [Chitinophagaceae bacterium]|nr:peptide chain release factor N(5)-glutamine methyltransferase [Chitinophagaceae bacterium]